MKILDVLQNVFRDVFDDDCIVLTYETSPNDIKGWDSLMHLSLLEAIKEQFHISFSVKEVLEIRSVADMIELIEKKI